MCNFGSRAEWIIWRRSISSYLDFETRKYQEWLLNPSNLGRKWRPFTEMAWLERKIVMLNTISYYIRKPQLIGGYTNKLRDTYVQKIDTWPRAFIHLFTSL